VVGGKRLLELHRRLYEANERRIRDLVATPRRFTRQDLDRYESDLARSIPADWTASTPVVLRAAIRNAQVLLVGDYHSREQGQRGFLRVLRSTRTRNLIVGLEFVSARYQKAVDDYVGGRIGDDVFLRRMEYARSWPSYQVWPHFRPIFQHAADRKARVVALDCPPSECGSVWSRASFAAWRIAEALRESPDAKVAVLMGEAHLAPGHLPAEVRRALDRLGLDPRILTLHQNLDGVWFELLERGLVDRVDVVRLAPDRFVVPASTPVAAQASFLQGMTGEEGGAGGDRRAVRRQFLHYVKSLARFIGVRVEAGLLEGVTVCGPGDLEPVDALAARLHPEEAKLLARHVEEGESLCMPDHGLVYLSNLGPTHVGEEAAHFLKARLAGGPMPGDPVDFTYGRILHEALGYFGAKIFNPKRKPPSESLLRRVRKETRDGRTDEVGPEMAVAVQLASWHRARQWRKSFARDTFDLHLRALGLPGGLGDLGPEVLGPAVHLLGYELGERIYCAFRSGALPAARLRALYRADLEAPGVAFERFHALATTLRSIRLPARF
jgi:hypothetical protein